MCAVLKVDKLLQRATGALRIIESLQLQIRHPTQGQCPFGLRPSRSGEQLLKNLQRPERIPKVIRVQVDGERNGLQQLFGPFDTGPNTAYACVWVYLVSGSVGIGVGNGGATNGNDVQLNKKGSWEALEVSNAVSPANSIVIMSVGGPADFYVESARVDTTRVPCKPQ